jgi:hypothetical protein
MGLSLRNFGRKITDVLGGVERQVNPFDDGATYSNPHPRTPGRVPHPFNGGGYGNNQNASMVRSQPIRFDADPSSNLANASRFNANNPAARPGEGGSASPMDLIRPLTRSVPDLATLVTHKDYQPQPGVGQFLFGKEKVKTFTEREKGLQSDFAHKHGLISHLATPLAVAGTGANILMDAATVAPVAKGAQVLAKEGVPAVKTAIESRGALNEAGHVKVPKVTIGVKERKVVQDKLSELQGKAYVERRPLTYTEQIKEGQLMEKLHGKPTVSQKPPKPAKVNIASATEPIGGMNNEHWYSRVKPIVNRLNDMGGGARSIAQGLINKRNYAETSLAAAKQDSPVVHQLGKDEFTQAVDHLEGAVKSKDPRIVQAANEMRTQFNKIHSLATGYGKAVKFRTNYFPHFNDIPKADSSGYQAAIQHLIDTKQAETPADASKLLEFSRKQPGMKKLASFEYSRKPTAQLPDYPKTVEAYHHYLEEAYKQIGHYKEFGAKDETLNKYLNQVQKQSPHQYEKVNDLFNRADSRKLYDASHEKTSTALTTIQGTTKLGTSFIGNAAQQANNMIAGGVGRTVVAAAKGAGSKADRDFVRLTGVTGEGVSRESMESRTGFFSGGFKPDSNALRRVTAPGFERVEKTNRAVGAITGRDQARTIAGRLSKARAAGDDAKAAKLERQLREKFRVQGDIGEKLTQSQEIDAAREFVHRTQFRTGTMDLPEGATSPLGRVITQFKRYPYKQAAFIGREIIKPLVKEGNPLPLVRAAGVGLPAGYGANVVRNKIRGQDTSKDSIAKTALAAAAAGGVTGLETQLVSGLNPSGTKSADAYVGKVAKTIGGPTAGDAVNFTKAGFTAATGKGKGNDPSRFTALERFGVTHIPDVGPSIANRALPYKKADGTNANAPADPNKPLSANERIKQAFTSDADKKFLAMSDADKKANAATDPNVREIYKEWLAAKSAFATPKLYNAGLDSDSTSTLNRYDRLTAEGKKAVANRDNGWEYQVALAKYNNDSLDPNWTDAKDINAQQKLAKDKVGTAYDKNTRDIYNLSKQEIWDYINSNPKDSKVADKLAAYDQALYKAGLIKSPKFKNGFDPSAKGSGSGKGSKSSSDAYQYAISTKASSGGLKKPRVSAKAPSLPKSGGNPAFKSSRPTVTLKKSKT